MADTKSERLGLRGTLTLFDSTLRLLGGANATGLLAAGATYHVFDGNPPIQTAVKTAATLFLLGVFSFIFGYMAWFFTSLWMDWSIQVPGEEGPEQIWFARTRTIKTNQRDAKIGFYVMTAGGAGALGFLVWGLFLAMFVGQTLK
jgi:hypothetical protein